MTRAQRVGITGAAVFLAYILVWLSILRVPFVDEQIVQEILPYVYTRLCYVSFHAHTSPAPLLGSRFLRVIRIMVARNGARQVP
jgi:hypothetical protein